MGLPSWLQWYKKPSYRDYQEYATALKEGKRSPSPQRPSHEIPSRLALSKILENQTCSPMSLYDFYMYLKHIEHSPENLEFYMWFRNYEATYAQTSYPFIHATEAEKSRTGSDASPSSSTSDLKKQPSTETFGEDIDEIRDVELANETFSSIVALINPESACTWSPEGEPQSQSFGKFVKSFANKCRAPFTKDQCTGATVVVPEATRREELANIIKIFLVPGAERELNIPAALRDKALADLETSSSPHHLKDIAEHCYYLLRNCSHRNFVRLGISNGTMETICVATGLGIVLTVTAFLLVFLRAFYPFLGAHSRFNAFAAWPLWWIGMSLILSGLRGSCFFLLLFSRRQPLPWERFDDDASVTSKKSGIVALLSRLMIFDRKIRVKDVALRRLQHKIVFQSLIGGALFASTMTAIFIAVPIWVN